MSNYLSEQVTNVRVTTLGAMRQRAEPIAMLTSYDATFARLCEAAGVDVILVGDSLGMVVQGYETTHSVELAQMIYHTEMVARVTKRPLIVADMPFATFQISPEQTMVNAAKLIAAGAHMVKIEGGEIMADTVRFLTERGIPVCGHIGLLPQSVHQLGGYRIQGKVDAQVQQLVADAQVLAQAGATMVVLEAVKEVVAQRIRDEVAITTIGIGAGGACHGQVLVVYDVLGLTLGATPRFVRKFLAAEPLTALQDYVAAVKQRRFPNAQESY